MLHFCPPKSCDYFGNILLNLEFVFINFSFHQNQDKQHSDFEWRTGSIKFQQFLIS